MSLLLGLQKVVVTRQIHGFNPHACRQRLVVITGQLGFHFQGARLLSRGQQPAQNLVHAALTGARRQVQQTQVFLAGPLRLHGHQHVIRLSKPAGRE